MGTASSFRIAAWAAWLPGQERLLLGGSASGSRTTPNSLRRRVTPIGRKALEAAWAVLPGQGEAPRVILSSRHGEYARTLGLLTELAESGEVSPAEFSLSVHHALAGLLSIASGNRAGHSAIAAGPDSFGYGLLEAAVCLAEDGGSTLLMHFDEALPANYGAISGPAEEPVALALLLVPADAAMGQPVRMDREATDQPGHDPLAVRFCDLLLDEDTTHCAATGGRMTWRWHRAA